MLKSRDQSRNGDSGDFSQFEIEMAPTAAHSFGTKAVHAGQDPDPITGAVIPALSLSTTFAQAAAGVHKVLESHIGL